MEAVSEDGREGKPWRKLLASEGGKVGRCGQILEDLSWSLL